jgi:hypothetical protein
VKKKIAEITFGMILIVIGFAGIWLIIHSLSTPQATGPIKTFLFLLLIPFIFFFAYGGHLVFDKKERRV